MLEKNRYLKFRISALQGLGFLASNFLFLFIFNYFCYHFPFLLHPWDQGQDQQGQDNQHDAQRDRSGKENIEASLRHEERLSKGIFHNCGQNEGKDERSSLIVEFSHKVTNDPEDAHDEDVPDIATEAVYPDYTKKKDEWE